MFKAQIIGNLTADPTLSESGACNFTVAATTSLMVNGSPKTEFVRVSVWGKRGETIAKHFKKGDPIFCMGDFVTSEFINRNNEKQLQLNLRSADFSFVGSPRHNESFAPASDDEDDADIFG